MKNWKSTLAFWVFVSTYVYSVFDIKQVSIIEITGYFLLLSMLFLMLRSEDLTEIIKDISSGFKDRMSGK